MRSEDSGQRLFPGTFDIAVVGVIRDVCQLTRKTGYIAQLSLVFEEFSGEGD